MNAGYTGTAVQIGPCALVRFRDYSKPAGLQPEMHIHIPKSECWLAQFLREAGISFPVEDWAWRVPSLEIAPPILEMSGFLTVDIPE